MDANSGLWESEYSQCSARRSFIALRRDSRSPGEAAVSVTQAARRNRTKHEIGAWVLPNLLYEMDPGRFDGFPAPASRDYFFFLLFVSALLLRLMSAPWARL